MAVHTSVRKRARQNEKARVRNRMWKSRIKTLKNKLEKSIEKKETDILSSLYNDYVSVIDKASSKGVIHKNNASRKKMRMTKKISSFTSAG